MTDSRKTVIYAANRGYALYSSRRLLIRRMLEAGWRVVIATSADEYAQRLVEDGAIFEHVVFDRGGFSPLKDFTAFRNLAAIQRRHRPSLVHHFHAKPVILGTAAARIRRGPRPRIVNTITGLGHAFIEGGLSRHVSGLGYRSFLPAGDATIFLNRDDRELFLRQGWARPDRSRLIVGSGVDTRRFSPSDRSGEDCAVLMVARLLRQKGVGEFISAAARIRGRSPEVRFLLAGEWDESHPDAVPRDVIISAHDSGTIEFLGYVNDVTALLARSSILVLPSYREGVPRTLLEAAACGIPAVAFNVPGCREVIRHEQTGLLVDERSAEALAAAITGLVDDPGLRRRLGSAARRLAESEFDLNGILDQTLNLYREIGVDV